MKRKDILNTALERICGGRDQVYGKPEDNFKTIANLWFSYLRGKGLLRDGVYISAADVALMMILFKAGRSATGKNKEDTWIDIGGYAACGGELDEQAQI